MGDNIPEIKTGLSSSKPSTSDNGGPIIKESQESEEYQQDLKVVLGTAFGVIVVVGLIVVALLLYRVYKARQRALAYTQNDAESIDRNISLDFDGKSQSVVLLLYSYDCPLHQRVVEALAGFLMEECGVTVTLDILEEAEIAERGIDDWLVDRLHESDYILVVCSLGSRLRCSKKHIRFKHDGAHILPDYFAIAVDYVSEKMRVERQKGLSTDKFMVAFMEYSTRSDIPPQLETAQQFCLMKDIHKLHTHLNVHGPELEKSDSGSSHQGGCENFYHESETGSLLKATIEQTNAFFQENPSWMSDRLEHTTVPRFMGRGAKSRKKHRSSLEQPLLVLTSAPWNQNSGNNSKCDSYQLNYSHSSAVDLSNSCSVPLPDNPLNVTDTKSTLNNFGISQNRQNSLPSSLTSSGLLAPPKKTLTSKSMDSFCMDSGLRTDHEGVPCLFCGSYHMDGRPECKDQGKLLSLPHQPSQESLPNDLRQNDSFSHSQTILHAEVHQEWGTPVKGPQDGKCNTFGCDLRTHLPDNDRPPPAVAFQSLPPHCPVPNSSTEWDGVGGKLRRWQSGMPDSPNLYGQVGRDAYLHDRRLSQTSILTDDSGSVSDTDSLERDLRSIQNISSFHDFVNSSSVVSRHTNLWHQLSPMPSLASCPPTGISESSDKDFYKLSSADIEMTQMRSSPIV